MMGYSLLTHHINPVLFPNATLKALKAGLSPRDVADFS
jgi:hypothetical protein